MVRHDFLGLGRPILAVHCVLPVLQEAAEAWLIWFTEQFNLWLRPVKIVIQPVITAGVTVIRPVITTGVTVVTMLWKFGSLNKSKMIDCD